MIATCLEQELVATCLEQEVIGAKDDSNMSRARDYWSKR